MGLTFNQRFTNEQGACLEIGENFHAMLLVEPFFQGFTQKPISDATSPPRCLAAVGATAAPRSRRDRQGRGRRRHHAECAEDHGFMFQHGFADLDGHQWEVFWMDEAAAPAQM
jgi:predicted lactoylglutathione lyase